MCLLQCGRWPDQLAVRWTSDPRPVEGSRHSIRDSDLSPEQEPYPVVILRAGASANVWNYSTLAEDLASHGYVVVGFDAPYRSFYRCFPRRQDNDTIPENNPELCLEKTGQGAGHCANRLLTGGPRTWRFVLDRLERLNTSDAFRQVHGTARHDARGSIRHSFGGAAALQFCTKIPGARQASMWTALHTAALFKRGSTGVYVPSERHSRESEPESGQIMANIDRFTIVCLRMKGAPGDSWREPFLFSDDGALLKSHIVMQTLHMFGNCRYRGTPPACRSVTRLRSFSTRASRGKVFAVQELISSLPRDTRFLD